MSVKPFHAWSSPGTSHLTLSERRIVGGMLQRKISVVQIAVQLGRHRSTIHREIRRNF
nr:helix-turn-helix domain-containing protein [Paracoccus hibiscisoli]